MILALLLAASAATPAAQLDNVAVGIAASRGSRLFFALSRAIDQDEPYSVVELSSGKSWRKLNDDPSTKPAPGFTARVEDQPLVMKGGKEPGKPFVAGADGIALGADGQTLYYAPLSSHHLYSVPTAQLRAKGGAATPTDLGDKGFASDGMLGDAQGRVYSTDYENNRVMRFEGGKWTEVTRGPDLLWPDSMALAPDGTLWFTTTEIERGQIARGKDERVKPFKVWTVKTDSKPLLRGPQP